MQYDPHYLQFFECWNQRRFWDCHEVLEHVWLDATGQDRLFYQGLIQGASAFVHLEKMSTGPASKLLAAGLEKLDGLPPRYMGFALREFVDLLETWQAKLKINEALGDLKFSPGMLPLLQAPETFPAPRTA